MDDLNDHWTCEAHAQEQLFVLQLLHDVAASMPCHITILSGDVHTSCVHELQPMLEGPPLVVNIVSSGIRHSPMPAVVALVIKNLPCQTNLPIGDKLWSVVPREWKKVALFRRSMLLCGLLLLSSSFFTVEQVAGAGPETGSYFSQVETLPCDS